MLDLFDLMTPRVVVISEKSYNERKRRDLLERRSRYQDYVKTYKAAIREIDEAVSRLNEECGLNSNEHK
jgi:hypothetical protein